MTHSPTVRGGRPSRSSRLWGRAQRMIGVQQWIADVVAPLSVAVWLTWDAACRQHRWHVHDDTEFVRVRTLLDLPHRAGVSQHARFESGHGRTFLCHCILMTVMTATSTMLVVFLRLHVDDNGGDQRRERAARQLVEQDGLPAVSDRLRRRSRQHLAISLPRLPERRRSVLLLRSRSL